MEQGELCFGTLECWVLSRLAEGSPHETDPTMAARTLLADARAGVWDPDLLTPFSVPAAALPAIVPTAGRTERRAGSLTIAASLADQAAALLAVAGTEGGDAMVNLGTGGFALRTTGAVLDRPEGYLAGPILAARGRPVIFAAEGTINGAWEALERFGGDPSPPPARDPSPGAFCIPDLAGLGAPHWLADRTLCFSSGAEGLEPRDKRRIVLEGILFRVREILEGLFAGPPPGRVILSGGLAREPGLAEGLAACLERPVDRLEEPEATLLGAAILAAGRPPGEPPPRTHRVDPGAAGRYLPAKWEGWKRWMKDAIAVGHG
jgi:glycerol kinase